jgi:hypothetical protein
MGIMLRNNDSPLRIPGGVYTLVNSLRYRSG